jgi:integrase/recombinase XerD
MFQSKGFSDFSLKYRNLSKVRGFVAKNNRHGQAEILKDSELDRIYKQLQSDRHRLFFKIARYTGERFNAICQLKVCDVYVCVGGLNEPLSEITFRAQTRKASPNGDRKTRQAFVCKPLADYLSLYKGGLGKTWLFPSPIIGDRPITFSAADKWLRTAVERAGLEHRGISTHTFRRTFITKLYDEGGLSIDTIQEIMGHANSQTTRRYIRLNRNRTEVAYHNAFH